MLTGENILQKLSGNYFAAMYPRIDIRFLIYYNNRNRPPHTYLAIGDEVSNVGTIYSVRMSMGFIFIIPLRRAYP
jgi:hypothetical protein